MRPLEQYLEAILKHLKWLNRPVVEVLRPGLREETLVEALRREMLPAPQEVVDLWRWRDGTEIVPNVTKLDDVHLFPGFYLYSCSDALRQYRTMRDDARWKPMWLPLFANGGGDFYAADLNSRDQGRTSIVGFVLGEQSHPVEYESVEKMCETLALCYERGIFYVSSEGYLEMDDAAHANLAGEINPSVEFWKSK